MAEMSDDDSDYRPDADERASTTSDTSDEDDSVPVQEDGIAHGRSLIRLLLDLAGRSGDSDRHQSRRTRNTPLNNNSNSTSRADGSAMPVRPSAKLSASSDFRMHIEAVTSGKTSSAGRRRGRSSASVNPLPTLLAERESRTLNHNEKIRLQCNYLPNYRLEFARYGSKRVFGGIFSGEGDRFVSYSQDHYVRVYDTSSTSAQAHLLKTIPARDVGWSITDVRIAPDQRSVAYSSWCEAIHLCLLDDNQDNQTPLVLDSMYDRNFCVFSFSFSHDSREIIGGASDGSVYIYDLIRGRAVQHGRQCHLEDVNAIAFMAGASDVFLSSGDDGIVRMWDRRCLIGGGESDWVPCCEFAGHQGGCTYIDPHPDGRHFLTNCKDQCIKLWDCRRPSSATDVTAARRLARQHGHYYDYRWELPRQRFDPIEQDASIMTYGGYHSVSSTLIRARFSPQFNTGGRYIICGSADGAALVYDVLSGEPVYQYLAHSAPTRDVHWHPYRQEIITSGWDGIHNLWVHRRVLDIDEKTKCVTERRNDFVKQGKEIKRARFISPRPRRGPF